MNGGRANNSSPITTKSSLSSSQADVYVPPQLRGDTNFAPKTSNSSDSRYESRGGNRGSDRDSQRGGEFRRGGGGRNFNSRGGDRQSGDFSNFSGRRGGGRYDDNYNGKYNTLILCNKDIMLTTNTFQVILIQDAVVTTGIAAAADLKIIATLNVVKTVAAAAIAVVVTDVMTRHATIVGKSLNVALMMAANARTQIPSLAMPAVVAATTEVANADMVVAGTKNAAAILITPSWVRAMNALKPSFSAPVIPASILTNTRIYPWKRRAKMSQTTSHPSMMCS